MPRYEFRCRECTSTFEVSRSMSASSDPAACPQGHTDTVKLLSTISVGRAGNRAPAPAAAPSGGGGGCCGGGCCG
ncbi:MAG TPA: zinc ribbon domain-containing protein [Pseudonocardiaceae bacterium]|nr:zinc ribbon domain-containing protein [Pseudonocardiaceae bacterium]